MLLYTAGVATGRISPAAMCRVLAENPAKLYGCFPRKGVIAPGSDADIVVYDPAVRSVIRGSDTIGAAGYTPYEGIETAGAIRQVYLRGSLAVDDGKVLVSGGGRFIARGKTAL